MRRFFTAAAAGTLALSLLAAPLASAQQMQQNHEDQKTQDRNEAPSQRPMQPAQHAQADRSNAQHGDMQHGDMQQHPQEQQHAQVQQRPPVQQHAQMDHSGHWQHGQRYTGDRRVVSDWGRYHANPPPRGYEWVQDGNELVLISITSGIIASVLANAFYQ
jgi:Ni/Co efflux regulator RcnB